MRPEPLWIKAGLLMRRGFRNWLIRNGIEFSELRGGMFIIHETPKVYREVCRQLAANGFMEVR